MLAARHPGSICNRCAFRVRLQSLQQARRRSAFHHANASQDDVVYSKTFRFRPGQQSSQEFARSALNLRDRVVRRTGGPPRPADLESKRIRGEQGFRETLVARLDVAREEVKNAPLLEQLAKDRSAVQDSDEERRGGSFRSLWKSFTQKILSHLNQDSDALPFFGGKRKDDDDRSAATTVHDLREAYRVRGVNGLDDRIKYAFYGHVTNSRFTDSEIKNQKAMADLRYPTEWFPATRAQQRTIHLHVGPTNSGKTYQALQRLEQAETGVYAGPLRLLAHEVFTRLNAKGKACTLITGEERRAPPDSKPSDNFSMASCTVEMLSLNRTMDVAVIDEIQMIGNADRGWAWTQALLGVRAREVHLCGEERTVPLIKELCASIGETLHIHRYERLSPLVMADQSLNGDLTQLRKGDCLVSFSVIGIHALRKQIERSTGRKVATVYGSLPPETRAQQARLFNDPNNDYDFLVASDAVGMGLNLAIKRIIFETSSKFDGVQRRALTVADIKQIAGRAGRFRTAAQATQAPASEQDLAAAKGDALPTLAAPTQYTSENVGTVTTLEQFDYPIVRAAMTAEPEPITSAGIFPPAPVLERFASYFPPGTPFSYMLTRLHELSQMHRRFHLCGLKDQVWIADLIEPVQGLTVSDRNIICSAPASKSDNELWGALMPAYARCIALQLGGAIVDVEELPIEVLEAPESASREYLRELERLHKGIVTYLWLSYRFAGIFNTRALAFHLKGMVEQKIEAVLSKFSFSEAQRKKIAAQREQQIRQGLAVEEESLAAGEGVPRESTADSDQDGVDGDIAEEMHPRDIFEDIRRSNETQADSAYEEARASETDELIGDALSGRQAETLSTDREFLDEVFKSVDASATSTAEEASESDPARKDLQAQTSLTAGGDRFSGEEDIVLEEPLMLETAPELSHIGDVQEKQSERSIEPAAELESQDMETMKEEAGELSANRDSSAGSPVKEETQKLPKKQVESG